jgi:hypothetical protein
LRNAYEELISVIDLPNLQFLGGSEESAIALSSDLGEHSSYRFGMRSLRVDNQRSKDL